MASKSRPLHNVERVSRTQTVSEFTHEFPPKTEPIEPPQPIWTFIPSFQVLVACPPTSPHASNSPPSSFQVQGSNLAAFTLLPPNGFPVLPNFFVANPVTPKLPLHYHQHQWNLLNNTICHSWLLQSAIIFAQTKLPHRITYSTEKENGLQPTRDDFLWNS